MQQILGIYYFHIFPVILIHIYAKSQLLLV